jgi:hypothetical protein
VGVLSELVRRGVAVLVLDHTGHKQAFVSRKGVSAPRGASSKGQKNDVVLEFEAAGQNEFVINHAKNRFGPKEVKRQFRVIDTESGGLDIEEIESDHSIKVREIADRMVEAVVASDTGFLPTNALRAAGGGGVEVQNEAMALLQDEEPQRLVCQEELIPSGTKRVRAKVWRRPPEQGRLE